MTGDAATKAWAFAPRSHAKHPKLFGKTREDFEPVPHRADEAHRVRAAQLQHQVAYQIRRSLAGVPLKKFIGAEGATSTLRYERVIRIQRGEVQMQLSDLADWMARFPAVRDAVARFVERFPPSGPIEQDPGVTH